MQGHDEACFRLLASGDEEMLEILIDSYALRVKQYAFDQLQDDYDAEEIAISTFTTVYLRNRNRGWRHASYETMSHLLVVTAKGLIGDMRRRRALEEERRQVLLRLPGPIAETPAERVLKKEMVAQVRRRIRLLPKAWQRPARLYFLRQYKYQEIADETKTPLNTVYNYISRARESLEKALRDYFKGGIL